MEVRKVEKRFIDVRNPDHTIQKAPIGLPEPKPYDEYRDRYKRDDPIDPNEKYDWEIFVVISSSSPGYSGHVDNPHDYDVWSRNSRKVKDFNGTKAEVDAEVKKLNNEAKKELPRWYQQEASDRGSRGWEPPYYYAERKPEDRFEYREKIYG